MSVTLSDPIIAQRFWAKVDKSGECWVWTGARWSFGHGAVSINRVVHGAHRISWQFANGEIPDGMNVLHHCDNPPCVNPAHLYLGSFADNGRDMAVRARGRNKLTFDQVREARTRAALGESLESIARGLPVCSASVRSAVRGLTYAHIPGAIPGKTRSSQEAA